MSHDRRVDALVANFLSWLPILAAFPNAEFEERHDVPSWTSSVPLPFFNGLVGAPPDNEMIDDLLARFDGVPVIWVVPPPGDITGELERRGFEVELLPGMTIDLATVSPPVLPTGVEIRAVDDDPALLESATGVAFTTNGFPPSAVPSMIDALARMDDRARFTTFLASVDGVPAAASALVVSDEVAGIYNVGTLPEFRRRGLGALVSIAALAAGRARGCTIGALQASQQAESVYRAIGFEECCRFAFAIRA
ncbi:MAG TPA: GNAT family N-acetyltransferase [Gaiellaceae bacterium]|nr:GNAT family N-acetyltransferase [Gaiellaceae bacterium]